MDKLKNNVDSSNGIFKRATRSQNNMLSNMTNKVMPNSSTNAASKRKAEVSPKGKDVIKRTAFVDLTNNGAGKITAAGKKGATKVQVQAKTNFDDKSARPSTKLADYPKPRPPLKRTQTSTGTDDSTSRVHVTCKNSIINEAWIGGKHVSSVAVKDESATLNKIKPDTLLKPTITNNACAKKVQHVSHVTAAAKVKTEQKKTSATKLVKKEARSPLEESRVPGSGSSSTDNTLYVTAREVLSPPDVATSVENERKRCTPLLPRVPANIHDFDREHLKDPIQVSIYAMDIFNYMRERESSFKIKDYMADQFCLTPSMRSLLVDWMVEVQETFELNHETLYLAVKLVDLYLSKVMVTKEALQLIGAASIFIASKFDERSPPLVDDFLYICDGAYSQKELIKAEINVFKTIGYDLGIPLSYRFLRRFARSAKATMPILTLARFILETSLMDYQFITVSDSKIAAACLFLALKMSNISGWTPTLEYYTSYKLDDIKATVLLLNSMLHRPLNHSVNTIRNKYSHKVFFEVAKLPLLSSTKLV